MVYYRQCMYMHQREIYISMEVIWYFIDCMLQKIGRYSGGRAVDL